jgi:hypothetical protein
LISTTTSVHFSDATGKLPLLSVAAGTAKLPFICKGVTFENEGKTRTTQRMKKK